MSSTKLTLPASAQRVLAIATAGALLPLGLAGAASAQTVPPRVDISDNACPTDQVDDQGYNDIDGVNDEQKLAINCIADYEIAQGTTTTTYGPTQGVSRAQMALFLSRYLDYAGADLDTSDAGFTDLAGLSQDARNAINIVANAEIALGTTATTYSPTNGVSRAQMASFINRLQAAIEDSADSSFNTGTDYFTDDDGLGAEDDINAIASGGIAAGTSANLYSPTLGVSRAQMALFIARSLEVNIAAGNIESVYGNPNFDNIVVTRVGSDDLVAVPNPDSATSDNAVYNVTGLEAGVEYRVTILEAGTVDGDDDSATFDDSDGDDNLAEIGDYSADLTSVNGTDPVNNDGSGRPATAFNGNTAVFTAGANGTSSFTIDGNAAETVRPVVYRNGGGDTDMSPEQGGDSGRLELNDDDTAAEAFGLGAEVTFTAPVLENVAVTPQEAVTLTLAAGETDDNDSTDTSRSTNDNRSYTVTGLNDGTRYRISLVNADSIRGEAGNRTFLSSEITPATTPGTFAVDTGEDIADIISVNGATQALNSNTTTATSVNGSITFTVDGTSTGTVVPAVYVDGTVGVDGNASTGGDDPRLETSATAAGEFAAATEVFGLGGRTTFTFPAAASQALAPTDVQGVAKDSNRFSANNQNFTYDDNDTFNIQAADDGNPATTEDSLPATLADFEAALSRDDSISATYSNNPALSSTFNLQNNAPAAPTAVTAESGADGSSTSNDIAVAVSFNAGDSVDTITIQRAPVAGGTDEGTEAPAAGSYTTVGTVTPSAAQITAGAATFLDNDVAVGAYRYRASISADGDTSGFTTAATNETSTAPAADTTGPQSQDARVSRDAGFSGVADEGDVFTISFDEPLATPAAGSRLRINDGDGTTVDVTNGTNATFTLNATSVTQNGDSRSAGTVLTVTLTAAPTVVNNGGNAGLQYSDDGSTAISNSTGITDTAGNRYDIGSSADTTLNVAANTTEGAPAPAPAPAPDPAPAP